MRSRSSSPWLMLPVERPLARVRMYCLPHAGGGASAYWSWASAVADFIEVCPVQLPGRESRFDELAIGSAEEVAELLLDQIVESDDRPYVLFGHSMGAALAFQVAMHAAASQRPGPLKLFASAFHSPTLPYRRPAVSTLPDDELIFSVSDYGGIPQVLLNSQEYLRLLLPTIRQDFSVVESLPVARARSLDCPVNVFGGVDDEYVTVEELAAWQDTTSGHCTVRLLPGGHFYLRDSMETVLAMLADDIGLQMELNR